jgi:hypothetical protein
LRWKIEKQQQRESFYNPPPLQAPIPDAYSSVQSLSRYTIT